MVNHDLYDDDIVWRPSVMLAREFNDEFSEFQLMGVCMAAFSVIKPSGILVVEKQAYCAPIELYNDH